MWWLAILCSRSQVRALFSGCGANARSTRNPFRVSVMSCLGLGLDRSRLCRRVAANGALRIVRGRRSIHRRSSRISRYPLLREDIVGRRTCKVRPLRQEWWRENRLALHSRHAVPRRPRHRLRRRACACGDDALFGFPRYRRPCLRRWCRSRDAKRGQERRLIVVEPTGSKATVSLGACSDLSSP